MKRYKKDRPMSIRLCDSCKRVDAVIVLGNHNLCAECYSGVSPVIIKKIKARKSRYVDDDG